MGRPDFVSTCFALIGLMDHACYRATPQAVAAVGWVLSQVTDVDRQPVANLALALIAVGAFEHTDKGLNKKIDSFRKRATHRLRVFVKRKWPERGPFFEDYIHFIGEPPEARREPFQVPIELVALNALIGTKDAENIRACRSAIFRLTSSIMDERGVAVDGKFRTETQLWAAKVLLGLDEKATKILSGGWFPWRARRFRLLGMVYLFLLTILALNILINRPGTTGPWAAAEITLAVLAIPLANLFSSVFGELRDAWKN